MEQFHINNETKKILVGWWIEGNIFFLKNDGLYTITNLRYIYVMDLMCILYGEPNCMHFKDACMENQIACISRMLGF